MDAILSKSICKYRINNYPNEPNPWDDLDEKIENQESLPAHISKEKDEETSTNSIPNHCPYEIAHSENESKPILLSESSL